MRNYHSALEMESNPLSVDHNPVDYNGMQLQVSEPTDTPTKHTRPFFRGSASKNWIHARWIMIAGILGFGVISIFSSCTPSYTYSLQHQPSIDLGDRQNYSIAIVNSVDVTKFNFKRKKKNALFANAVDYLDYHIAQELNSVSNFHVIQNDTSRNIKRYFDSPHRLNRDRVSDFCAEHDVDFLVGLESFDASFSRSTQVTRLADGSKDRTTDFTLAVETDIAVYDSAGIVLFRNKFYRDMFYEQRSVIIGILAEGPQIQNASTEIRTLCEGIVNDFISSYYPSVTEHTQYFYKHRDFDDAIPLLESAMWQEAIDLLQPISNYEKDKTKGKACFNIAVCYKFLDDQKEAIKWYGKAVHYLGRAPWFELPY